MPKVVTHGTSAEILLVSQALSESRVPLEPLLTHDYSITFYTPDQFREKGWTLPDGSVALGHVAGPNALGMNSAYAKRRPKKAKHVVRHEVFHAIQGGKLTAAKKAAILPGLRKRDGTTPPRWAGVYQDRPSEIVADGLAAWIRSALRAHAEPSMVTS